jgi:ATP-dependent RNA helicase RhlE
MLDMGFIHDLRRIVAKVPDVRQTLLFSATMPPAIRQLADQWLRSPVVVNASPVARAADTVRQSVLFVEQANKIRVLTHWFRTTAWTRTLVFTRTKRRADKVAKSLREAGIAADAFHADKSQAARQRSLAQFKSPRPAVLVATDIAARGLDIDMVSHVINFDLPAEAENYVHRIGRTGRAGADGVALSFCDAEEHDTLRAIQRLTKQTLAVEGRGETSSATRAAVAPQAVHAKTKAPAGPRQRPQSRRSKPSYKGR